MRGQKIRILRYYEYEFGPRRIYSLVSSFRRATWTGDLL